jgi:hypothetical protein
MWENGYNVYAINLQKVTDEITDSLMKSFQLIFKLNRVPLLLYLMISII